MAFEDWAKKRPEYPSIVPESTETRSDRKSGHLVASLPRASSSTSASPFTILFDEQAKNTRSRRHEKAVADLLNRLLTTGEFSGGSPTEVVLGYTPSNRANMAPDDREVIPLQEMLDRILAKLAELGKYA